MPPPQDIMHIHVLENSTPLDTFDGTLGHLNVDGIAEPSEPGEGCHPRTDVHLILFAHFEAIDCVHGLRTCVQLKSRPKRK